MNSKSETRDALLEILSGCWKTQVAGTAVSLGLPDLLARSTADFSALTRKTNCAPESLLRLLKAMCALGLTRQTSARQFQLTPLGELLRTDTPGSLSALAGIWAGSRWDSFSHLEHSVRTGKPAPGGFLCASPDPGVGIAASQAQVARSHLPAAELAERFDFSGFTRVLDVGGGHGTALAAVLKRYSHLGGAVFDLPHHEDQTKAYLRREGVADRGGFIAGSFFHPMVRGFDCLILKSILHDWQDDQCRSILRNCAASLRVGGTLLVLEEILPELAGGLSDALSAFRTDLTMLVSTGGMERTLEHFRTLLVEAGFELSQHVQRAAEYTVLECRLRAR